MSVDLLMITWNRFEYAKRTIDTLLSTSDDFRLFWWDNGSKDGVSEYIDQLQDPRIYIKHKNDENVRQAIPTRWFLEHSSSKIIGKLDDDTLVSDGWIKTIASSVESYDKAGMVGCWTFWLEDFDRNSNRAAAKVRQFGKHQLLWNISIGGTAFLVKRDLALKYLVKDHNGNAFPIDRERMSVDGYLSGWYYPLIWCEHMDDPRSVHCLSGRVDGQDVIALSARVRGFKTNLEFLSWIKNDADEILTTSTHVQIIKHRLRYSIVGRGLFKARRLLTGR
jgi:hypothetical protein